MKTVLVADDSIIIQKSIDISLSHSDVNVIYASSAAEALTLSQQQKADLFILDVSMPDKNGIELCKELKNTSQYQQTPVIMLSSAQNPMDQNQLDKIGAQDLILKPFETSEVSEKVHGYLNHLSSPPTRDEESFFTSNNNTNSDSNVEQNTVPTEDNLNSSYDIGFSSVDDVALTEAEISVSKTNEDMTPSQSISDSSPKISDFAFDNSELSGIDSNSNLDSISNTNLSESPQNQSTDINFDNDLSSSDYNDVIEVSADYSNTLDEQLDAKNSINIPSTAYDTQVNEMEDHIQADPVEAQFIEPSQVQTTEAYVQEAQNITHNENSSFSGSDHSPSSQNSTKINSDSVGVELSDQQIESIVTKVFENVIERIAWEVVPDIAEKMIREEISRLTKD